MTVVSSYGLKSYKNSNQIKCEKKNLRFSTFLAGNLLEGGGSASSVSVCILLKQYENDHVGWGDSESCTPK